MAIDTLLLQLKALDFFYDLILTTNTNKKEAVTKMKNVLNDEEKAFNVLIKLKEQEKFKKALKLQATAMHFTEEAINNMTRGLTDANTTSVVIKAEELQGYARVDVWDLLYDGSLNKRERQMVSDNLDFQDYAQYDLFLARNTTKKEAMTNMKNALNDEEKAFYELIKLKAFIAAQDEKKKEDLLKPGKKAQEEDAVDKNFWKNP